jgi:branched-chain amino acid transport system ATP-binding protein
LLLEVKNLEVHYYKVAALKDISFDVEEGSVVTLIGANGAGKTTVMRTITGLKHPSAGEIWFQGKRIDKLSPDKVNGAGISLVPEGRRVFPQLSVMENLRMGAYLRKDNAGIQKSLEMVFEHFPRLKERTKQAGGTLSGGEQQMLAMGRALMSDPALLLLDEPSMGLSPIMVSEVAKIVRDISAGGRTILLVEQNARLALALAQKGYVLETGKIVLSGPSKELLANEGVKKAYLGLTEKAAT